LQAIVEQLCETNQQIHDKGLKHIAHLEAKESANVARARLLESELKQLETSPYRAAKLLLRALRNRLCSALKSGR
jgi:hypothetical protein